MERYKRDCYSLPKECFVTYDPKAKGDRKLLVEWLDTPHHESVYRAICDRRWNDTEIEEIDLLKSKQTFFSWLLSGVSAGEMLRKSGFRVYAQSRKDEMSIDLLNRVAYLLRNVAGPLAGQLTEGRDWEISANVLKVHSVLGEERESSFTALPSGPDQWRGPASSLAILDEFAYHRDQLRTHEAAASSAEGGGILVVCSTPKYETHFNRECLAIIEAAKRAELLGLVGDLAV